MDAIVIATNALRGNRWRHIVLTIPSTDDPKTMAQDLLRSFRRLRQRVWWKRQVHGGFFVVEVTRNKGAWHAHLHIAVYSKFLYASALGGLWRRVSSGCVTKIKLAPGGVLIRYLTGYMCKSDLPEEDQKTASHALKSLRLFGAFGEINKLAVQIKIPPFICSDCGSQGWIHERDKCYAETRSHFEDVGRAAGKFPAPKGWIPIGGWDSYARDYHLRCVREGTVASTTLPGPV